MEPKDTLPEPTGVGIDRSLIRAMLALTPTERVARLTEEARFLAILDRAAEAAGLRTTSRAGPPQEQ